MDSSPTLSAVNETCVKTTSYWSTSVIFSWRLYMDGVDCQHVEMLILEPNSMIY